MRLKDGFQVCPKCGGSGCYRCARYGWLAQCPVCMNSEPELVTKSEDELKCIACGTSFDRAGKIIDLLEESARKGSAATSKTKT